MKKILVTGAAGFIKSHLVKRLVKQGHDVITTDNLERGKFEFLEEIANEPNFHFVNCDLTNYNDVKGLFTNCEVVIHLASKVGGIGTYLSKPYEVMNANITMDSNVLRCIIENKIDTYFYASSAHIYPKELQQIADSPKIREDQPYPQILN